MSYFHVVGWCVCQHRNINTWNQTSVCFMIKDEEKCTVSACCYLTRFIFYCLLLCIVVYSLSGDSSTDDRSTAKPYWFSAKHSSGLAPGWTHLSFRKYQRHCELGRYIQLLSKQEAEAAGVYWFYHKAVLKVVLQSFVKWVQGQFSFSVPVH